MTTRRHDVGRATTSTIVAPPNPTGHYVVRIDGYSQTKARVPAGDYVSSLGFAVGGHAWKIRYYPNGADASGDKKPDCISLMLMLHYDPYVNANISDAVNARFVFSLLDRDGEPVLSHTYTSDTLNFNFSTHSVFGSSRFVSHDDLEKSEHLIDGERFAVRCDVTVMKGVEVRAGPPPSSLGTAEASALRRKLDAGRGADVRFRAGGETFTAHRRVLAWRSPELEASLCRRVDGGGCLFTRLITRRSRIIDVDDDMDAAAFGALLHFVYTDTLPEMAQRDVPAMVEQLMAAANKYQMERLKLLCHDKLWRVEDTAMDMLDTMTAASVTGDDSPSQRSQRRL